MCDLKATNERRRHIMHPRSVGPPKGRHHAGRSRTGYGLGEISLVIDECTFTSFSGGHMFHHECGERNGGAKKSDCQGLQCAASGWHENQTHDCWCSLLLCLSLEKCTGELLFADTRLN